MNWQERVRARLGDDGECAAILQAVLDGFERGGPEAVADVIRQRLKAIEDAFDEPLRNLEAKL